MNECSIYDTSPSDGFSSLFSLQKLCERVVSCSNKHDGVQAGGGGSWWRGQERAHHPAHPKPLCGWIWPHHRGTPGLCSLWEASWVLQYEGGECLIIIFQNIIFTSISNQESGLKWMWRWRWGVPGQLILNLNKNKIKKKRLHSFLHASICTL